jgi:hypothetical protein
VKSSNLQRIQHSFKNDLAGELRLSQLAAGHISRAYNYLTGLEQLDHARQRFRWMGQIGVELDHIIRQLFIDHLLKRLAIGRPETGFTRPDKQMNIAVTLLQLADLIGRAVW